MTSTSRRTFVIHALTASGALAASSLALSQTAAAPMVKDTDANAVALGYKADGSKTDTKKYPKYAASQNCANCALYQGAAGSEAGPCPLFAGKQVAAAGWCASWVKKTT
ncbi:high-potential iron-sulfur protein [Hydrogenophaga sp.]|uniref:high-potential iron-sulfur protein n=1 Tax=Hydrogenophaga sp. TaxID=1904254 RepID=UPI0027314E94|nr:high-potential iron-sulfur protein [Hydrogenophaga sp.]MDP1688059.1 high-potential iron-sulfur protein [Hydrogenophaga sp.]